MIKRSSTGAPEQWYPKEDHEWYSRGYAPHRDKPGLIQAITFHLGDSLPQKRLDRLKDELIQLEQHLLRKGDSSSAYEQRMAQYRRQRIHQWLDAGCGNCVLRNPVAADIMTEAFHCKNGKDYNVLAWCVMPNHVHIVIRVLEPNTLGAIVKAWKSVSTRQINTALQLDGSLWGRGYYDRFIRDATHLQNAIEYTEHNPVAAGLVKRPEDWKWSSAGAQEHLNEQG